MKLSFGQRLQKFRKEKGLSIKELSAQIDVPVSTYREWEYGRKIKGEPYPKIAKALGVSLNELFALEIGSQKDMKEALRKIKKEVAIIEKNL